MKSERVQKEEDDGSERKLRNEERDEERKWDEGDEMKRKVSTEIREREVNIKKIARKPERVLRKEKTGLETKETSKETRATSKKKVAMVRETTRGGRKLRGRTGKEGMSHHIGSRISVSTSAAAGFYGINEEDFAGRGQQGPKRG